MGDLEVTAEYQIKPKLVFVGRLLGMDLYIDVHAVCNPMEKRELAEKLLKKAFEPIHPSKTNDGGSYGDSD